MYCKCSAVSSNVLDIIPILVSEIMVMYIAYRVLVLPLMTCCLGVGLWSIYTYRYLIGVYTDHLILAVLA